MRSSKLNIEIYIKMYKKDKATVCEVTVQGSSNSVDFKLVKPILGVLERVQSLKKKQYIFKNKMLQETVAQVSDMAHGLPVLHIVTMLSS